MVSAFASSWIKKNLGNNRDEYTSPDSGGCLVWISTFFALKLICGLRIFVLVFFFQEGELEILKKPTLLTAVSSWFYLWWYYFLLREII